MDKPLNILAIFVFFVVVAAFVLWVFMQPMTPERYRGKALIILAGRSLHRTWPSDGIRDIEELNKNIATLEQDDSWEVTWDNSLRKDGSSVCLAVPQGESFSRVLLLENRGQYAAEVTKQGVFVVKPEILEKQIREGHLRIICYLNRQ